MPIGMGHAEAVALQLYVDDWARTVRRWSGLIGAYPSVTDVTDDGRKRARFASRSFAPLDLVEAGLDIAAGDSRLYLCVPDVEARAAAIKSLGGVISRAANGELVLPAQYANGVEVRYVVERLPPLGQAMTPLPYVLDISVNDVRAAAAMWDAIMGIEGTFTSIETDSARQFNMRHYVTAGEAHAIGLMSIPSNLFIKRDSLGSSHEYILRTHGEGVLCLGFIYKTSLDSHIAGMPNEYRDLLIFEEPRSYQMGRNNMSHADQTGGFSVVIAQHFEGWSGDPRLAKTSD